MSDEEARLKFSIAVDGAENLVPVALSAVGNRPLKFLDLERYGRTRLRALCILLLLAKDRSMVSYRSNKDYEVYAAKGKRTWVGTLAAFDQRGQAIDQLFTEHLFVPRFWKGMRGGGKGPHVRFFTKILPPDNLDLKGVFKDGRNWRLRRGEIRELAYRLEDEFIKEKIWEVPVVPSLIQRTDLIDADTELPGLWKSRRPRDQPLAPEPEVLLPPDSPLGPYT